MRPCSIALSVAASLLLAGTAAGQSSVRPGEPVTGSLNTSDPTLDDGSFYEDWSYRGGAGERVTVTLRSSDFDAFLHVGRMTDGSFEAIEADDDGAGGTDSQITLSLPTAGTYVLRVNTLVEGEAGAYTLQVESGGASRNGSAGSGGGVGEIALGQTVSGRLDASDPTMDDGSYVDLWGFQGSAGQPVTITLRSTDFDTYLSLALVTNGQEVNQLASDDDSGGGTDAQISITLPADGVYVIGANALADGETGAYTLSLEGSGQGAVGGPSGGSDVSALHPSAGRIAAGRKVSGELSASDPTTFNGTVFDDWIYEGKAGERLAIVMRASGFDAYLQFGSLQGGQFSYIMAEDDGAGGTDSLVEVTLPEDGRYVIRANTLFDAYGPYTLELKRR